MPTDSEIDDAETISGGPAAVREIVAWLTQISRSIETEGDLTLSLHQMQGKTTGEMVCDYTHELGDDVQKRAEEIVSDAEDEARPLGGKVKFKLKAAGKKGGVIFPLVVDTPGMALEDPDADMQMSRPDVKAIIAQQMRQNETFAKTVVVAATGSSRDYRDMNQELRAENRELRQEIRELRKREDEVRNFQFARDRAIREDEEKAEMKRAAFAGLKQIASVAAAHYFGGATPAMGAGPSPFAPPAAPSSNGRRTHAETLLQRLFMKLDREKLFQIAPFLDQEEIEILREMHGIVASWQEEDRRSTNGHTNGNGVGHTHANGGQASAYGPPNGGS